MDRYGAVLMAAAFGQNHDDAHADSLLRTWQSHERSAHECLHESMVCHGHPAAAPACHLIDLSALVRSWYRRDRDERAPDHTRLRWLSAGAVPHRISRTGRS